ncbi:hypothetical protein [Martelella alba]|uniref:hypothetical protein n=1 Tax=Martelella alba TaxID=2590451 RepID=UPI0014851196|nr:hypothetical protein [Martelella alba]
MKIWAVMMGFEFLLFGVAAIMVIIWMRQPDDHLDDMLKEIERQDLNRLSNEKVTGAE